LQSREQAIHAQVDQVEDLDKILLPAVPRIGHVALDAVGVFGEQMDLAGRAGGREPAQRSAAQCCAVMPMISSKRSKSDLRTCRAQCACISMPRRLASATERGSGGLPHSSLEMAALSTSTSKPAARALCIRRTWAVGERQIFPVQMNKTDGVFIELNAD